MEMTSSRFFFMTLNAISVFVEALPFLIGGAFIAAIIELYIKPETLARIIPKNRMLSYITGVFAGFILPVCECGIIPVVKKLLDKKVPLHTAIVYMIAGPVVNPLVILSTWIAFRMDLKMVFARIVIISIMAVITAVILGDDKEKILKKKFITEHQHNSVCSCGDCSHEHNNEHQNISFQNKLLLILSHTANEFAYMAKFLALGAIAAGFFKTYIPVEIINYMKVNIFGEIVIMMLLAFLLNVCSEADAFVSYSFSMFSKAARIAFVTYGPPADLKQLLMYNAVFTKTAIIKMFLTLTLLNILGALIFNLL